MALRQHSPAARVTSASWPAPSVKRSRSSAVPPPRFPCLEQIGGALDASLARSDEQLAYYVAQAREVVDLSLLSQKQVMEELQQLATRRGKAGSA